MPFDSLILSVSVSAPATESDKAPGQLHVGVMRSHVSGVEWVDSSQCRPAWLACISFLNTPDHVRSPLKLLDLSRFSVIDGAMVSVVVKAAPHEPQRKH